MQIQRNHIIGLLLNKKNISILSSKNVKFLIRPWGKKRGVECMYWWTITSLPKLPDNAEATIRKCCLSMILSMEFFSILLISPHHATWPRSKKLRNDLKSKKTKEIEDKSWMAKLDHRRVIKKRKREDVWICHVSLTFKT